MYMNFTLPLEKTIGSYFEGDIILTEKQKLFLMPSRTRPSRYKRSLIMEDLEIEAVVRTWPRGVVVYEMSADLGIFSVSLCSC